MAAHTKTSYQLLPNFTSFGPEKKRRNLQQPQSHDIHVAPSNPSRGLRFGINSHEVPTFATRYCFWTTALPLPWSWKTNVQVQLRINVSSAVAKTLSKTGITNLTKLNQMKMMEKYGSKGHIIETETNNIVFFIACGNYHLFRLTTTSNRF